MLVDRVVKKDKYERNSIISPSTDFRNILEQKII